MAAGKKQSEETETSNDGKKSSDSLKKRKNPFKWLVSHWKTLLVFILIVGFAALAYGYIHTKNELNKLSDSKAAAQSDIQQITKQIDKTVELPTGETPLVINITDAAKAKSQGTFFKSAQNGDKVLFYQSNGVAILYRPSTKKVILYAPINLGNNVQQ